MKWGRRKSPRQQRQTKPKNIGSMVGFATAGALAFGAAKVGSAWYGSTAAKMRKTKKILKRLGFSTDTISPAAFIIADKVDSDYNAASLFLKSPSFVAGAAVGVGLLGAIIGSTIAVTISDVKEAARLAEEKKGSNSDRRT